MPALKSVSHRPATGHGAAAARAELMRRLGGGLAHDFNHMLTVIVGASERLAADLEGDRDAHALALMTLDAAERGSQLIRRILALASGQGPALERFEAAEVIETTRRFAEFLVPAGVAVTTAAPSAPLAIVADRAGLDAALLNLCINAGQAMGAGGRLALAARRVRLAKGRAERLGLAAGWYGAFEIADTGAGMSPQVLARATEANFTTRAAQGGSGLGLASVKAFAASAGGALTIASKPGAGTRAVIFLPLASPSARNSAHK